EAIQKLQQLNEDLNEKANELLDANKEIDSFNYSVSHDLRAPLRSIIGFSKILMEELGKAVNPPVLDSLERIVNSAQLMNSLIEALLGSSRLTRKEIVRGSVDLSLMANEILTDLRNANPERQVEVVVDSDIVVKGDAHLLRAQCR